MDVVSQGKDGCARQCAGLSSGKEGPDSGSCKPSALCGFGVSNVVGGAGLLPLPAGVRGARRRPLAFSPCNEQTTVQLSGPARPPADARFIFPEAF